MGVVIAMCAYVPLRHILFLGNVLQNQYILGANSQALIAIAITPPQHDPQSSQKLALASVVVTLFAILTAMASSGAEVNAVATAADQRLDKGIKLSAFGMTLVALVLFVIAIAKIQGA
ncbi:hypothetical protein FRC01_006862 [Tulasnella sp. 417]|nr:hypothetical protein FRC01_006862 [Tulasnella sp. 417]